MIRNSVNLTKVKNIHLMGVGGAGMSAVALLFHEMGYNVSGCDTGYDSYAAKIEKAGVKVIHGHDVRHLNDERVELLVYSSAIPASNPELVEARRRGIPIMRRAELLSVLFDNKKGIGVAGAHGKTTTSSLISYILEQAGMEPTIAVGGELRDTGSNAKLGKGSYMVAELDESDGSFEFFHPLYSVVTNVDWDHVNYYPTFRSVQEAFARFLKNNKKGGKLILCGEDPGVKKVIELLPEEFKERISLFGRDPSFDYHATEIQYHCGGGASYTFHAKNRTLGTIDLITSGEHNVIDSLAACAVAYELGVPFETVQKTTRKFHGAKRRIQKCAICPGNILLYDDYGHHPREIEATINALRLMHPDRRIVIVFQPHRYTRTQALYKRFAQVLTTVPQVILLPIYAADEQPIPNVTSELIAEEVRNLGGKCITASEKTEAVAKALQILRNDDLLLTEGAGDVCQIGSMIEERLNKETATL